VTGTVSAGTLSSSGNASVTGTVSAGAVTSGNANVTGTLTAANFTMNGTTTVTNILTLSSTVTHIASGSAGTAGFSTKAVSFPGAASGDTVIVTPYDGVVSSTVISWSGVAGTNVVAIRLGIVGAFPGWTHNWRITVIKF
jgi:hypothetical protein